MSGVGGASEPSRTPFSVHTEDVDRFKHRLLRTKTIQSQSSIDREEAGDDPRALKKVLTTFDLTSLGVGSCCGTGMYVVAGMVAKNVAGPSTIFSFFIAAIASILSGICYGEFGVRVPKTSGSAYMYSYVSVGEFVAFLIGWNLILEYIIGSAAGASALSACFDALGNHSMSDYLSEHVGTVIGSAYPDFLGFVIAVAMTAILSLGVKHSMRLNTILNGVNLVVFVFIVIAGLTYADVSNWTPFAPHGVSGVFSGAATCFYAFIGFDIIATTGEEAQHAGRSIPRAIVVSLAICLVSYASVTVVLTLMLPTADIHPGSALVDAFAQVGLPAGKYVVAVGAIAALTVSLLGSMFPMPRVIYAMSRDGLLFKFLSEIHPKTGTPLMATVITGTTAAFMSLMVSLDILVEMMSIGTLLAYTLVSLSVLMLRYQPPSADKRAPPVTLPLDVIQESPAHTPGDPFTPDQHATNDGRGLLESSTGEQQSYGSVPPPPTSQGLRAGADRVRDGAYAVWLQLGFPASDAVPCSVSAKAATVYIGALVAVQTTTCMLIVFGHAHLARGDALSVICLLILVGGMTFCIAMIMRQPQNKKKLAFMAPAVPVLPCAATFFNTYLMLKLPALTWARLGVWLCLGVVLYFTYGMWHSTKEQKQRDKQVSDRYEKELAERAKSEMNSRDRLQQDGVGNTDAHCGSVAPTDGDVTATRQRNVTNQNGDVREGAPFVGVAADARATHAPSGASHSAAADMTWEEDGRASFTADSGAYEPPHGERRGAEYAARPAEPQGRHGSEENAAMYADEVDPYAMDERLAATGSYESAFSRPRPRARHTSSGNQNTGLLPAPESR